MTSVSSPELCFRKSMKYGQCAVGIVNIKVLKQNRLSVSSYDRITTDDDDDLGVGGASEGVSLPPCAQMSLLVVLVSPNLICRK